MHFRAILAAALVAGALAAAWLPADALIVKPARHGFTTLTEQPTLDLDFRLNPLSDDITFTRATDGACFNSAGVLTTFASGAARLPCFRYDGTNWINRGLLIEEERTNLARQSETVAAPWTSIGNLGIVVNNSTAPDGTNTADRLNDITSGGYDGMQQNHTISTTNLPYTYSVYVQKFVQSTFPEFQIDMTGGVRVRAAVQLDTQTGATSLRLDDGGGSATVNVTELENHWRIELSVSNAGSNTLLQTIIFPGVTSTFGVIEMSALGGINVWGHQLEQASFATSYIKTTTAAVTRSMDVATISDVTWFNQSAGTFLFEWTPSSLTSFRYVASVQDADNDIDESYIFYTSGESVITQVAVGGVAQVTLTHTGASTLGQASKRADAVAVNDAASSVDGSAVQTDTPAALPTITRMIIGNRSDGARALNGYIARITYWPRQRPNITLQDKTAWLDWLDGRMFAANDNDELRIAAGGN